MTDTAPLAPPVRTSADSGVAGDWARPMLDRQLQVLGELAEIGLELARAVEAGAKAPKPAVEGSDLDRPDLDKAVLAYSRVSRAVRQTIMLQSRLIEALKAAEAGEAEKAKALQARRSTVEAAAKRVLRRAIEAEHTAPERVERLLAEAAERLEDETFGDVLVRPIREIIAGICADLGLDPDWADLDYGLCEAEEIAQGADRPAMGDPDDRIEVVWLKPGLPQRGADSS